MTDAILVILGIAIALAAVAIVVALLLVKDFANDYRGSISALMTETRNKVDAELQRDAALAGEAKANAENASLRTQNAALSKQLNDHTAKESDDAAAKISQATDGAAALATLDRDLAADAAELQPSAAGPGGGAPAGAPDRGHAGQDAVRPTATSPAAPSGGPGRGSAG